MKGLFSMVAGWLAAAGLCLGADASRPNILVILCDDLGYADVGFNGAKDIRTPALDRLAGGGTVCTSGYVAHPFCGPSRMGLLSGRYPHEFGGQFNHPNTNEGLEEYDHVGIPVEEVLISSVLQKAGYFTGAIGKWHLGIDKPFHPNSRGFDDFYGFLGGGHMYFPEKYEGIYQRQLKSGAKRFNEYNVPLEHNGEPVQGRGYLTDELTGEAVRFLGEAARRKKQPFFLYLAYNAPHSPMEATEEDEAVFKDIADPKRRTYAAMVYAVDRGVGRIVEALRKNGQYEDTLVVFLSDNGGKPSQGACNAPLRGQKGDTFEGGFRVPMFFHWAGKLPAQKVDFPVTSLDFYPTFAALGRAAIPAGKVLEGRNILAGLASGENPRKGEPIFSMRHRAGYTDVSARRDDWKAVRYGNEPWRLFNLAEDPGENNDLALQNPERLESLVKAAEQWSRSHVDPLWFDSPGARDNWHDEHMPHFGQTFEVVAGARKLAPSSQELPGAGSDDDESATDAAVPQGVRLKKGDSTREQFLAMEQAKWEKNGWAWDPQKAAELFDAIDANHDGIASGQEKKAYWASVQP